MAERLRKQSRASIRQSGDSQSSTQKTKTESSAGTRNTIVPQNEMAVARAAPRFLQDTSATSTEAPLFPNARLSAAAIPSLLSPRDALSASQLLQTETLSRSQLLSSTLPLGSSQLSAHGLLQQQNQSLPTTVPYEHALGRSLELAAGAKARGDALLNVIKEREQKRLQEMEYASRLMLSARRQEDQLASLLSGSSSSVQNPLLSNASNPYAWLPATLPPTARGSEQPPDCEPASLAGKFQQDEKDAGSETLAKRSVR